MTLTEQIGEMLNRGTRRAEIARELGVSPSTVTRHAARLGYEDARAGPKIDWVTVNAMYTAGHSTRECLARYGISARAWMLAIERGDVTPRSGPSLKPSEKRAEIGRLLADGWSQSAIAAELGLSKPTVSYHARKLGVPARDECSRRYDWSTVQRAIDDGLSFRQCKAKFGFSSASWHDAVSRGEIVPRPWVMPLDELLVEGRKTNRWHLKQRLLKEGLKHNRCEECGITEWRGRPLNMHLHHINGDGLDNRIENLSMLCGNCHSQTDTYGGRNGHRRKRRDVNAV